MAKQGETIISATLDTKDIDNAIQNIDKNVQSIAASIDGMVNRVEQGFDKVAQSADNMSAKLSKSMMSINGKDVSADLNTLISKLNVIGDSDDFSRLSAGGKEALDIVKKLNEEFAKTPTQKQSSKKQSAPSANTQESVINVDQASLNISQLTNYISQAKKELKTIEDDKSFIELSKNIVVARDRLKGVTNESFELKKALSEKFDSKLNLNQLLSLDTKTISESISKVNALKNARDNLSKSDANYNQQLKQINNSIFKLDEENKKAYASGIKLETQKKKIGVTMESLTRQVAYYASVTALVRFSKELVNITGEFELQKKSLAAIIQNKGEADKLFARITELAVQSPFQLKELVTYTKQLAAYRVETEKLYDTTKMLGDISSGLGVSMDRLVLVFGQMKSATRLRGQEVRQITEAGIPILDELARKFTILEGRIVSVGEVFDKISNKEVSFKMVDEVFKDMTESGGMFYKMQELQAETLKGKLSNLTDAYQIMLNNVGSSMSVGLKTGIDSMRFLMENYQILIGVMAAGGVVFAASAVRTMILKRAFDAQTLSLKSNLLASKSLDAQNLTRESLTRRLTVAEKQRIVTSRILTVEDYKQAISSGLLNKEKLLQMVTLGVISKAKALELAATLALTEAEIVHAATLKSKVIVTFTLFSNSIKAIIVQLKAMTVAMLKNPMTWVFAIGAGIWEMVSAFKEQKEVADELAKKTKEQQKELSKIKDSFDSATESIIKYNNALAQKNKNPEVVLPNINTKAEYGKQIIELQKLIDLSKESGVGLFFDMGKLDPTNIQEYFNTFYEMSQQATIYSYEFAMALNEQDGWWSKRIGIFGEGFESDLKDLEDSYNELFSGNIMNNIDAMALRLKNNNNIQNTELKEQIRLLNVKNEKQKEGESNEKYLEREQAYNENRLKILKEIGKYGAISGISMEDEQYISYYNRLFHNFKEDKEEFLGETDTLISDLKSKFENIDFNNLTDQDKRNLLIGINTALADKELTAFQKKMAAKEILIKLNIDTEKLSKDVEQTLVGWKANITKNDPMGSIFTEEDITDITSYLDFIDKLKKAYNEVSETITELEKTQQQPLAFGNILLQQEKLNAEIKKNKENLEAIKKMGEDYGIDLKKKKSEDKGKDKELERVEEQIKLYEKLRNLYNDLTKKGYSYAEAQKIVSKEFGDASKRLFGKTTIADIIGLDTKADKSGGVAAAIFIEGLSKGLKSSKAKEAIQGKAGEIRIDGILEIKEVEIADLEKALANIKTDYEIGLEIKGMGDMGSIFANMFDYNPADLETTIERINTQLESIGIKEEIPIEASVKFDDLEDVLAPLLAKLSPTAETTKQIKELYDYRKKIEEDSFKKTVSEYNKLISEHDTATNKLYDIDRKYKEDKEILDKRFATDEEKERPTYKRLSVALEAKKVQEEAKIEFEGIKGSDAWVKAFEDLNRISTSSISSMIVQLEKFKEAQGKNLSPTELREYSNTLKSLQTQLEDRTPFNSFIDGMKEAAAAKKGLLDSMAEEGFSGNIGEFLGAVTTEYYETEVKILENKKALVEKEREIEALAEKKNPLNEEYLAILRATLSQLEYQGAELTSTSTKLEGIIKNGDSLKGGFDKSKAAAALLGNQIKEVGGKIKQLAGIFGMESDSMAAGLMDVGGTILESGVMIIGQMANIAMFSQSSMASITATAAVSSLATQTTATIAAESIKKVENASLILAVISAALTVAMAIANLFIGNKNKKIDKDIEKSEGAVKNLQSAYNDLGREVEKSMGSSEIAARKAMATNLEMQRQEIKRQIALEESRSSKKRDQGAIDELQNKYKELGQQVEDTMDDITEMLLGTDIKAASEGFANAFIDAWKEGGDVLSALNDKFDDMIQNMIVKSLASKIVAQRLKGVFEAVEKAYEDNVVSEEEIKEIGELGKNAAGDISKDLAALMESLGIGFGSGIKDNLSALQKGISGITEPTAEALESLLNTIRFEIYVHTDIYRKSLIQLEMQTALNSNLVLYASQSYLLLKQMRFWQESITAVGHPNGGNAIRVFID